WQINDAGDFVDAAGSVLGIQIGGTAPGTQYDQIDVAGSVSLAGSLNVSLANGFTPSPTDVFTFIHNTSPVTGTFPGLPQESVINVGGTPLAIDYNDVTLSRIHFVVSAPANAGAGQPFNFTVTAEDAL